MRPKLTKRYQAFQRISKFFSQGTRKLLSISSTSQVENIECNRSGQLFRSTIYDNGWNPFQIFHRGSRADLGVIRQIFIDEDYNIGTFKQATWITAAYKDFLAKGMTPATIDAGSNIGLGSVYLKRMFPASKIIAVEPSSANLNVLQKNLTGLEARIIHGAIHGGSETIDLLDPDEGEWGFSTHSAQNTTKTLETVRCYQFSDLLVDEEVPFILKVDIEGGEKEQFNDVVFLSQFALIIIELHDWLYPGDCTSTSFLKFAANADFDFCHRGENIFLFNRRFK